MRPCIYEINARCWLRDLSAAARGTLTFADVPETEFENWQQLGVTHIWLMGIWKVGPRAREQALAHLSLRSAYTEALPGWTEADVPGSPYAIAEYVVLPQLGGEPALDLFRRRLHARGMKLLLDFVPNHVGLDHPWVTCRPELLVQAKGPAPGTFPQVTSRGALLLAHGKDPFFPPWTDTAQVDMRNPESWAAAVGILRHLASLCDGVRCDMAMLLLTDIFERNWAGFPRNGPSASGEFWSWAIAQVKARWPQFLFVAEAYWGTERRLRSLGFDLVYDKTLLDLLVEGKPARIRQHLATHSPADLAGSVHFLENHDELRIASVLPMTRHPGAALLVCGLPGIPMLHEGQLTGMHRRIPVQLARRCGEPAVREIETLYAGILGALKVSLTGLDEAALITDLGPGGDDCIAVRWSGVGSRVLIIAVNLSAAPAACMVPLPWTGAGKLHFTRLYPGESLAGSRVAVGKGHLRVELPPHGHVMVEVRSSG